MNHEVVAIQAILELLRRAACSGVPGAEHPALDQVHVQVAVVVEVEQRRARRHDFRLVEPAGHPVEVDEVEAALPLLGQ